MEPISLTGKRVRLSVPTLDDVAALAAAADEPSTLRYIVAMPDPYTEESARSFIENVNRPGWEKGTEVSWSIRLRPADWTEGDPEPPVIGGVGLAGVANGTAEIGWWLASSYRGQGLVPEAAGLVVDWAFDRSGLGLERLLWRAAVSNWPSRRVAWRLGFRVEGLLRAEVPSRGAREDGWMGTLLPGDPRQPNEPWPNE
ncbi:MAG: GNAT family N-acetyltransferase [Promicromonosporaceae bacterium]|nr:GNAT family N-acetyltransferase [Promicromonosporaceae bacterium]